MMKSKLFSRTTILGIIVVIVTVMMVAMNSSQKAENSAKKPEFTLLSLEGKEVSLSDYRGKVVLVNFWATWCPPCVREIPDLVKLRKAYKDKNFEILGIVLSSKEAQVHKMVKNFAIDYPILWGTQEAVNEFGNIPAIPRTFIINAEGEVVEDIEGMGNYEMFETLIKKYLKG
ncbi:MAG: TlpA family protein disulfide reductase [Methanobacteriota archaeon]|nr:MAG: TlpA family protein disulfide reductase [Euryarchaeota archaeon]